MKSLTIGIDATCWANARGYGRFTREICSALVALDEESIRKWAKDNALGNLSYQELTANPKADASARARPLA